MAGSRSSDRREADTTMVKQGLIKAEGPKIDKIYVAVSSQSFLRFKDQEG